MKKIFTVLVLLCATLAVSAQEVPSSFPRKFLIEHFTGDQCGYCPYGMYSIVEHIEKSFGNTKVLKEMNRKYTKEQYLNLAQKMLERIPGLVLSTDIIVGFPNESDEQFNDTREKNFVSVPLNQR